MSGMASNAKSVILSCPNQLFQLIIVMNCIREHVIKGGMERTAGEALLRARGRRGNECR
jgi:hypothetical protein